MNNAFDTIWDRHILENYTENSRKKGTFWKNILIVDKNVGKVKNLGGQTGWKFGGWRRKSRFLQLREYCMSHMWRTCLQLLNVMILNEPFNVAYKNSHSKFKRMQVNSPWKMIKNKFFRPLIWLYEKQTVSHAFI